MKLITICLLGFVVVGCPPPRPADKPIPVEEPSECEAGCVRAEELECNDFLDELKGLEEDLDTCTEACEYLINTGIVLNVSSWKDAKICEDFDTEGN